MKYTFTVDGVSYATLSERGQEVLAHLKAERVANFKALTRFISVLLATAPILAIHLT
jgi:hypothetical protein